jgi:hypothetical protein
MATQSQIEETYNYSPENLMSVRIFLLHEINPTQELRHPFPCSPAENEVESRSFGNNGEQ